MNVRVGEMLKNPKISAVLIHPSQKRTKISQTQVVKPFRKKFMMEAINKAVREQRYFDSLHAVDIANKNLPLPLRIKSYDDIFKKLIEGCQTYFTKDYGKNEDDYRRFVDGCTKEYEIAEENENLNLNRMHYFKKELEREKEQRYIVRNERKKMRSFFYRFKSKSSKSVPDTVARFRSRLTTRKSKINIRRTRRISKKIELEEFEKSGSELSEFLSDITVVKVGSLKRSKPFIYKLSDPEMKRNGITVNYDLPLRIITFSAVPSNPLAFWFQRRPEILQTHYPNGSLCARFEKLGNGAIYYKNGGLAISFEFGRTGPLIIVYSESKWIKGKLRRPVPVALFDLKGNGIVYNSIGHKRLIYDQAEGILIDSPSKVPIKWKWNSYDQVMCRRSELQFVPPTNLKDFDYEEKKIEKERKFHKIRKTKLKKLVSNSFIGKFSKNKRKSMKMKSSSKLHVRDTETRKSVDIKPRRTNLFLANLTGPKILKFVGQGFVIKPMLTPCYEVMHLTLGNQSVIPKESGNRTSQKTTQTSRPISRVGHHSKKPFHIVPELKLIPLPKCKIKLGPKSLLKPIILKLTENVSLTIMDQQHIHIDFSSFPMHYMFCIGVSIIIDEIDAIFDIRASEAEKEPIPSIFELLKTKCRILHKINNSIKKLRINAEKKFTIETMKKLKNWGQAKHFGKVPFCELMNNDCLRPKCNLQCRCVP